MVARHSIVPPYLLARLAQVEYHSMERVAAAARRSLRIDAPFRYSRLSFSLDESGEFQAELGTDGPVRTIGDARNLENLPGSIVRREGDRSSNDRAVNEAYDGLGSTWNLYRDVFHRNSIDGLGLPLNATVHYGEDYDNAFWDGTQMVFGDGDGEVFAGFTRSLSVIGHELAHGVTQNTVGLNYEGQSGALNESLSDVFGALVEQYALGQSSAEASWLIGAGLFTRRVEGAALRSMKEPGSAYDDDILGKDPQPGHMDDFVVTRDDYGGVHINSGIPNRAFFLVADALGGNAWASAGRIWYDTIAGGDAAGSPLLPNNATFAEFAAATHAVATSLYGDDSPEADAVLDGWAGVGVDALDEIAVTRTGTES